MEKKLIERAFDCFQQMGETSSRNAKAEILETEKDNPVVKDILYRTYNPYWTYGVSSQTIPAAKAVALSDYVVNFVAYKGLCTSLRERTLTGNEAKRSLHLFFGGCTVEETKWYRASLCKDLDIGIQAKTINSVIPDLIPSYDVMLAAPWEEGKLEFPVYAEPKIDGIRCISAIDCTVSMLTRNGHGLGNFPQIREELQTLFPAGTVVDGELVSPDGFQSTMKQVFRKDDIDTTGFQYHIFDILTFPEFNGETKTPYVVRKNRRKQYRKSYTGNTLIFVKTRLCEDMDTVKETYSAAIEEGYEGLVLKAPEAPYVQKRSATWMKVKSDTFGGCIDVDLPIIDYEMGTGKFSRMLGALVCSYNGKLVKVGTGLTDADRRYFKKQIDNQVPMIVRVVAQEETEDGSLRFPRFVAERKDL